MMFRNATAVVWIRRHALALLLTLFALLATISSLVVPPFETPDEIWHFAFIQQLASGGGMPVSEPATDALWRQQGVQAPGYYLAAAALTFWIDQSDFPALYERTHPHVTIGLPELLTRNLFLHYPEDGWPWSGSILALRISRFFSIGLAVIALWASYQALRLLLGHERALAGVALVAFLPQYIFIAGAASNDNAINAMAALLLWRLVVFARDTLSPSARSKRALIEPLRAPAPYLLIGVLLGLAILAKLSGLSLTLLALLVLAIVARRVRAWRIFAHGGLLVLAPALLISGWWFVRNWQLYGHPLALNIWYANILLRDSPASLIDMFPEFESLHHSFWGLFGWFNIAYPTWLYRALEALTLLIGAGALLAAGRKLKEIRRGRPQVEWRWLGAGILLAWILFLTISWLGFMRVAPAAQGRYFHPAAATLGLIMVVGLGAWPVVPGRPRLLSWVVAGALFVLSVITPWWQIAPSYARSEPLQALPEGATPLQVRYGDAMVLEGFDVSPAAAGPSVPIDLTLYWRALEQQDELLSISVKGFGRDDQLVARDDSYPDAGRWPTTLWQRGQLIADRKRIWFSGESVTPAMAEMTVDVYRLETLEMLPATVNGAPVAALPFNFLDIPLRQAGATPAAEQPFIFRPVVERVAVAGSEVEAAFAWEVGQRPAADYRMFVHLTSALDAPPISQIDPEPQGGDWPTSAWWPGDRLSELVRVPLPSNSPEGDYLLVTGLYEPASGQRIVGEDGQHTWTLGRLRFAAGEWTLLAD